MSDSCVICGREKAESGGFVLRGNYFCPNCEATILTVPIGCFPYRFFQEKIKQALFGLAAGE